MREDAGVKARFLLGPAGSGKTFRCLAEIRAVLKAAPDGDPLVLLAPKQATFQLERQLLATPDLAGTTRLRIFSFDRLAGWVLEQLRRTPPALLSEEGRIMVLRALLRRHQAELPLFGGSVSRPGFAREAGKLLAELQEHGFSATRMLSLAEKAELGSELRAKLRDLACLQREYAGWLKEHALQDANCALDFATAALQEPAARNHPALALAGLWLDGFAEMTPQEQGLLAAIIPCSTEATLAFCLGTEAAADSARLSIWSPIGKNFRQLRARLENLPDCRLTVETLANGPTNSRFAGNPVLARLEANWAKVPTPAAGTPAAAGALQLVSCPNPEAEAVYAAREILRFVRQGGRYRDCAVLVRGLEPYHQTLARVFRRYQIPFFLDRRESVAHHPLAELTRNALRTVAFDWQAEDWFAALKAGFSGVAEERIDELENTALEYGWHGKKWHEPLPSETGEPLRLLVLPPFERLARRLPENPTGTELAAAVRALWEDLEAGETLDRRAQEEPLAAHGTVWDQMNAWLKNVELAFPREAMPLADWLPVLEAGLMNLTVGVIPPALDEVLIGAIDRARNPDLQCAFVLGVNESVFPAPPEAPVILTATDREALELQNASLGPDIFDRISREHYLGYIACTRAEDRLAVTFARQDAAGQAQNPSAFITQIQKLFPELAVTEFAWPFAGAAGSQAEQACELVAPLVQIRSAGALPAGDSNWGRLLARPALQPLAEALGQLAGPGTDEQVSPALAEKIYGSTLRSSVSRLEEFAQCPFRFFVHSGLQAGERKQFELDARERGSFQHEVLDGFHRELQAEGKRWRDLTPAEARQRIARIAAAVAAGGYREGLMRHSAQTRFTARMLAEPLQEFVATLVAWMQGQYGFDPLETEFGFGFPTSVAPAWEIGLANGRKLALRGRIDRIDVCRDGDRTLVAVMDYKSSQRKLDPVLMEHGVQLQLAAYLAAIGGWPAEILGAQNLVPAGMFYVNLRGQHPGGGSRNEVLQDTEGARTAWKHSGRLDAAWLKNFDRRPGVTKGDQFHFKFNKDGKTLGKGSEAWPAPAFRQLLQDVAARLQATGEKIYAGGAAVDPYRKGTTAACDHCDYRAVCRIDPWTHEWRVLRAAGAEETAKEVSEGQ